MGRQVAQRGQTRAEVARLLAAGLSQAEIARQLSVSAPTVCFHARRLGVRARSEFSTRYDWAEIRAYYEAGHSATQCRERFGFGRNAWADAIRRGAIVARPRLEPLDQVLATGRRRSRQHVKSRLTSAGLKAVRCEVCGLTDWRERPLPLELHHINGDGADNRLDNLQLLCPNCHSQTDTWGARNKERRRRARLLGGAGDQPSGTGDQPSGTGVLREGSRSSTKYEQSTPTSI